MLTFHPGFNVLTKDAHRPGKPRPETFHPAERSLGGDFLFSFLISASATLLVCALTPSRRFRRGTPVTPRPPGRASQNPLSLSISGM
jgi:hypothetical protein